MAADPALPEPVRERLADAARRTAAYNLRAVSRFEDAVAALAGIPVCPLKGIYLLDTVYRDEPGARVLGDVDLLVPAARIDEAVARLEAGLGMAELPASRRLRGLGPERILAGRGFALDLHDRLGFAYGWASTWDDLAPTPARVHGLPVHALGREATLVHLMTHLVKHRPLRRPLRGAPRRPAEPRPADRPGEGAPGPGGKACRVDSAADGARWRPLESIPRRTPPATVGPPAGCERVS
jgi:hypothetical protein